MNHALELAYTHIPVLVLVEKFPGASEDKIQGYWDNFDAIGDLKDHIFDNNGDKDADLDYTNPPHVIVNYIMQDPVIKNLIFSKYRWGLMDFADSSTMPTHLDWSTILEDIRHLKESTTAYDIYRKLVCHTDIVYLPGDADNSRFMEWVNAMVKVEEESTFAREGPEF
ncbi:hypothetical protein BD777DRAFT_159412 [Yarrowia lipolytica]|nr:hypothetical protein BD777DRAFT_159412 [Yarrowia lipolytica]